LASVKARANIASLPLFHMGLPSGELGHANRVAEQLEDERLLDKLRRGR